MAKVSVITVNFRQAEYTIDMLRSIQSSNAHDIEVIVVENGWQDDRDEEYRTVCPQVKIVHSKENLGFAGGNNLGIKEATGKYLFFLNNDTTIPVETIGLLVAEMERDPQCGVISPRIYYYDQPDTLQYAGFTAMNWWTAQNQAKYFKQSVQLEQRISSTAFAHGAAMMVSRNALEQVGMMDENYFLYYEELDWVHRISKAGFDIKVHHGAHIFHKESISTGKASPLKTYFLTRNRILFMRKNAGKTKWVFYLFFGLAVLPKHLINYARQKNWQHVKSMVAGTLWHFRYPKTSNQIGYIYEQLKLG